MLVGALDVGKRTLSKLKDPIALIPGGVREMVLTDSESKVTKLLLKDRKVIFSHIFLVYFDEVVGR